MPEHVIMTQKLTWGDVHGENITVQRTAAMHIPTTGFDKDALDGDVMPYMNLEATKAALRSTENIN